MEAIIKSQHRCETTDKFWYEDQRLASFNERNLTSLAAGELAADGFHSKWENSCVCAFCFSTLLLRDLEMTRSGLPIREVRKRHNPSCPLASGGISPNVPLIQCKILSKVISNENKRRLIEPESICPVGHDNYWRFSIYYKDSLYKAMKNYGLEEYWEPKRRDFLTYETRTRSFWNWPKTNLQNPLKLAEAGFFYYDVNDDVRCFYCNIGLRNWGPKDKPFTEHARWNPDCHFVLLQKGLSFVKKIHQKRPPYLSYRLKESIFCMHRKRFAFSDEEFDKLLDLSIPKEVLRLGWSEEIVKDSLMRTLSRTGHPFPSLKAAIETIAQIPDEANGSQIWQACNSEENCEASDEVTISSDEEIPLHNLKLEFKADEEPERDFELPSHSLQSYSDSRYKSHISISSSVERQILEYFAYKDRKEANLDVGKSLSGIQRTLPHEVEDHSRSSLDDCKVVSDSIVRHSPAFAESSMPVKSCCWF